MDVGREGGGELVVVGVVERFFRVREEGRPSLLPIFFLCAPRFAPRSGGARRARLSSKPSDSAAYPCMITHRAGERGRRRQLERRREVECSSSRSRRRRRCRCPSCRRRGRRRRCALIGHQVAPERVEPEAFHLSLDGGSAGREKETCGYTERARKRKKEGRKNREI